MKQLSKTPQFNRLRDNQWEVDNDTVTLFPIFHELDPKVNEASGYKKQLIFKVLED